MRVLLGADLNAVRALLSRSALDARLAAFIVPYLGESAMAKSAVLALRTMADEVPGLLGDAMLSPTQPLAVRRRVPHALRNARGQGAARALILALSADALDVRYRAALALLEVTRHDPSLLPESKQVHALALAEASHMPLSGAAVDHIFALLSLSTSRGGLTLVRQGLRSDDKKLRGTALEYLESLLPESLHAPLVRAFAQPSWPPPDLTRSQTQLLDELTRSLPADLAAPTLASDPD